VGGVWSRSSTNHHHLRRKEREEKRNPVSAYDYDYYDYYSKASALKWPHPSPGGTPDLSLRIQVLEGGRKKNKSHLIYIII